ncbi:DUF4097 family beta strand repeat-containing protein [Selenomonas sp. AB3002]|uniref:DUF4097 family beta strand repeat-containing protein n=1 Tax=Selenomonas sp. AB3002 TaxID=1392502 RepID=UPI0004983F87
MNDSLKKIVSSFAEKAIEHMNNQKSITKCINLEKDFHEIDLLSENGDINILHKNDIENATLRLEITTCNPDNDLFDLSCDNGILKLRPLKNVVDGMDVFLYLPFRKADTATLKTDNGTVDVKNIAVNKLKVKASNSKIKLQGVGIEDMKMRGDNGSVSLEDIYAIGNENLIDCKCRNGRISLKLRPDDIASHYIKGELSSSNGKCIVKLPNLKLKKESGLEFDYGDKTGKCINVKLSSENDNVKVGVYGQE